MTQELHEPLTRQRPVMQSMLMIAVPAVIVSVAATGVLLHSNGTPPQDMGFGIAIAAIVPAVLAPLASYRHLMLLHRLTEANRKLQTLARTDDLTGIHTRRFFMDLAEREAALAKRSGTPLSLLLLDLDRFKRINDRHGHLEGDAALVASVEVIAQALRGTDIVARFGGEEFIVLLPHTDQSQARHAAERVRRAVATHPFEIGVEKIELTVSVGYATLGGDDDLTALITRADAALYAAKRNGRNRVQQAGDVS